MRTETTPRPTLLAAFALVAIALGTPASAQTEPAQCQDKPEICAYDGPLNALISAVGTKDETRETKIHDALRVLVDPNSYRQYFVLALSAGTSFETAVAAWERARVDKQVGAGPKATGTTDLVARPSTPDLLGLAVQLGALTETVNGTTATFNANAYGSYRAIIGQPEICLACADTPWRKLNFALTFDLSHLGSRQVPTTGAATPSTPNLTMVELPQSSRQFSSVTARYDFHNPLDPRSPEFKQAWSTAFKSHSSELAKAADNLVKALEPVMQPFVKNQDKIENLADQNQQQAMIAAAEQGRAALNDAFAKYFIKLEALARAAIPDLDQKVAAAAAAYAQYAAVNYDTVQGARQAPGSRPQFTAEYTYDHPQSQPDSHELMVILAWSPPGQQGAPPALFTLNLGGSIYGGAIPAGTKYGRARDFQVAFQFDRAMGDPVTHPVALSLAGYVQYQPDPSVLDIGPGNLAPGTNITLPQDAKVLLGTKGFLGIVQAKLTINTKSGVNIPFAVSWANKTDLLKATDVRGHVGITYDFESLSQIFGGK
jgi:hypothetical protein